MFTVQTRLNDSRGNMMRTFKYKDAMAMIFID